MNGLSLIVLKVFNFVRLADMFWCVKADVISNFIYRENSKNKVVGHIASRNIYMYPHTETLPKILLKCCLDLFRSMVCVDGNRKLNELSDPYNDTIHSVNKPHLTAKKSTVDHELSDNDICTNLGTIDNNTAKLSTTTTVTNQTDQCCKTGHISVTQSCPSLLNRSIKC